ncbi:HD domain-containing protein [Sphingobacterium spiritivorum]|uniref:HD domain protein n=1 Tax=Sphingobacterium spiritivorum ATCC 33861 TaxID=525373 RepID=D7VL09_SPHSI|nr:HD domain-containing protein [Sphingobacterium spiritivorum]EFK58282.1 HD domain protein [Sphingobacterium spiritivorum ATCC 33861]QQT37039.1 HD domain-containing protein [Sphingobacterium spiritivorum]WQD33807.1 HD domain-containing protein [Sphingobacterium spiritivorum]SUJ27328.1 putative hydrolase [Sphingobacterium spiritivorum]
MNNIIEKTVAFVKKSLEQAESGHDWWHIQRVWNNTRMILQHEEADELICELTALLHDIADSKFHNGDETIGPRIAGEFLSSEGVDPQIIEQVQAIILNMSFKASLGERNFHSKELEIVQDADRLDAIGAIGIARAFTYGGFKNREIHNPNIPVMENMDKEAYKKTTAPTINHFYEKLLLLKDKMNTPTAKKMAEGRHQYMEQFLEQFYAEWEGVK